MTSPFLATYKEFPVEDDHNLQKQLVNSYSDLSIAVNNRIIGTFQTNVIPNGERWFPIGSQELISPQRLRDGNRLVVQVADGNLTIAHGITLINQVTRLYGAFFDGTLWWPLPYVDLTAVNNQINVKVSTTQIIVTKGAGAPPSISSGVVVLEYL